jgi:hypothetical protein
LLTTISMHAFHNFITILQILLLWWSTLWKRSGIWNGNINYWFF